MTDRSAALQDIIMHERAVMHYAVCEAEDGRFCHGMQFEGRVCRVGTPLIRMAQADFDRAGEVGIEFVFPEECEAGPLVRGHAE